MAFDWVRRDKINKTVILDSCAILSFFEFSVDWQNELGSLLGAYHLVVPTAVVQELRILATRSRGGKKATAALAEYRARYGMGNSPFAEAMAACKSGRGERSPFADRRRLRVLECHRTILHTT